MNRLVLILAGSVFSLGVSSLAMAAAASSTKKPATANPNPNLKSKTKPTHARVLPVKMNSSHRVQNQAAAKRGEGESIEWTKGARGWMRTLSVSDGPGVKPLAETQTLAIDGQYLIVPWGFVSEMNMSRRGARFFVDDGRNEARLIDFDLLSNVALMKVDRPLTPSFYRSQLRADSPRPGETLLVYIGRDWSRTPAKFVQTRADGSYEVAVTTNSSSSAPAQWFFDRTGRLVALAPLFERNVSVSSASARGIYDMLRRHDGPRPASTGLDDQRRRQLFYWQDRAIAGLFPSNAEFSLRGLDCKTHLMSVPDKNIAAKIASFRSTNCALASRVALSPGYATGFEVWSGEAMLRPDAGDDSSRLNVLEKAVSHDAFGALDTNASIVNLLTVPECADNSVVNTRGENVRVRFCTSALKVESGLNDTAAFVGAVDASGKANYVVVRMKGFSQASSKRMLQAMIDNVRSLK